MKIVITKANSDDRFPVGKVLDAEPNRLGVYVKSELAEGIIRDGFYEVIPDPTHLDVIKAMRRYGGGFCKALAEAYCYADPENQRKIRETWSDYWEEYTRHAYHLRGQEMIEEGGDS